MRHAHKIIQALRENPDGLSTTEIAERLGIDRRIAYVCTKSLRDTWIDRYIVVDGTLENVWCIAIPLPDAPRPDLKRKSGSREPHRV